MPVIVLGLIGLLAMGMGGAAQAQAADLAEAKAAYIDQCGKCHGIVEGEAQGVPAGLMGVRIASSDMRFAVAMPYGPSLRGVYGRAAGSMPDFDYSKAFRQTLTGVIWQDDTLERWMTDSQKWAPGTRMYYRQPDAAIRRRILDYLKAHSP